VLLASLAALWRGHPRLHGRINVAFFGLTAVTLVGFEMLIRVLRPEFSTTSNRRIPVSSGCESTSASQSPRRS